MHKQTIILIVILALVSGVLIFLAITNQDILKNNQSKVVPSVAPVKKTTKVFFNPANIDLSASTASPTSSVSIMVDTGGEQIAGVQAEMQYDPKAITDVKLIPAAGSTDFFGPNSTILQNDIVSTTGRISFAIGISPTEDGKSGVGKIATVTFKKAVGAPATSMITFIDKTLASQLNVNESVLKETTPLTITISNFQPTQARPVVSPSTFIQTTTPTQ